MPDPDEQSADASGDEQAPIREDSHSSPTNKPGSTAPPLYSETEIYATNAGESLLDSEAFDTRLLRESQDPSSLG